MLVVAIDVAEQGRGVINLASQLMPLSVDIQNDSQHQQIAYPVIETP